MHVVLHTPGLATKTDLSISVGDSDTQIIVSAQLTPNDVEGNLVAGGLPSKDQLQTKVDLPTRYIITKDVNINFMVCLTIIIMPWSRFKKSTVKANVRNGVTVITLRIAEREELTIE
jgi:hypothetical protein